MITNLRLRNWRAYENLNIEFKPGTTFVVARNGVGKTSLVESARWALFGDFVDIPDTAIRVGATEASAEVRLTLPDGRALEIRRTLRRPKVRVSSTMEARVDGEELSEPELTRLLEEAWGASMVFLARTTFLAEGFRLHDDPDLLEQLSRAFGISDLQRARDELVSPIADLNSSLKHVRSQSKGRETELSKIREQIAVLRKAEKKALQQLEAAREEVTELSKVVDEVQKIADARERWRVWNEKMSNLLPQAPESVQDLPPAEVSEALEEEERRLTELLELQQRERAIIEGRLRAVEAGLKELRGAEGMCPVCRRPLHGEDLSHAERGHNKEIEDLRDQFDRLDFSDLAQQLRRIKALIKQIRAIGPVPTVPDFGPDTPSEEAIEELAQAKQKRETAVRMHQDSETRRKISENQLDELQHDLKYQEKSEAEYRRLVLLETAQLTIDSVVDDALKGLIAPLTEEIRTRWRQLFVDRPDLQIEPSGDVSRLVNGEPLPFRAFSAGEQMSAKLLLRLITLASSTAAGFCWIDEPLEHLDPTTRRLTAGMLARGAIASGINQMVVTTYEDDLARLLTREDDRTQLVYVRTQSPV